MVADLAALLGVETGAVEQQRNLGATAPSLYDLRNLFQVNVEEGRHLWAMVYLLHAHFGREGREEAEELLHRNSGSQDAPRKVDEVAQAQGIPVSFLENILTQLRSAGIVRSQRGPEGGYWLARPADQVTLAQVIRAVEGPLVGVRGQRPEEIETARLALATLLDELDQDFIL